LVGAQRLEYWIQSPEGGGISNLVWIQVCRPV
jgi:hypothetical protein